MKLPAWLTRLFTPAPPTLEVRRERIIRKLKVTERHLELSRRKAPAPLPKYVPPKLPPGVVPDGAPAMAFDNASVGAYQWANMNLGYCGMAFPGYPYLAELSQISEYISPVETTAQEATRRWIKLVNRGEADLTERIAQLEDALIRFRVRECLRRVSELDGYFGRGQLFIDVGTSAAGRANPLVVAEETIGIGDLVAFTPIEPMWTTPIAYNAFDPTALDYYKPTAWYIMGVRTDASRLLTFIHRPLPDLLKPAYNFSGLSMSQLMQPYVNNWLKTRDGVNRIINAFSTSGIATDMGAALEVATTDTSSVFNRAELYSNMRDNFGVMVLDKDSEEFFQFNVPLSTLDKLQAQAQEHMSAPSHTPLVKLLGVTPSGLNTSTDGEETVYRDYIHAYQESFFNEHLRTILKVLQLNEFGEIDDDIVHEWVPLEDMSEEQRATIRKSDGDLAVARIAAGIIAPEEERARIAADPTSGYSNLDVEDVPELPDDSVDGDGKKEKNSGSDKSKSKK